MPMNSVQSDTTADGNVNDNNNKIAVQADEEEEGSFNSMVPIIAYTV